MTGWTLFAVVPFVTHFSPLYEAALQNAWIHSVEHALLFGSGLLIWWPLVASDRCGGGRTRRRASSR